MKYIIFSDIDGTLYPKNQQINKQNITEIENAIENGIEFVLTTGNGTFQVVKNLLEKFKTRYAICANGAAIWDNEDQKFIHEAKMNFKIADEILQFANGIKSQCGFWDEENLYCNSYSSEKDIEIFQHYMYGKNPITVRDSIEKDIFKMEFYDSPEKVSKIYDFIKKNNYKLEIARMKPNHIEITGPNISKGHAIEWMAKHFGYEKDNIMAIGDSANDVTMLKKVKFSYAMANASDEVKKIANYHTSSAKQGGLGEAIVDFMYKKKIEKAKK